MVEKKVNLFDLIWKECGRIRDYDSISDKSKEDFFIGGDCLTGCARRIEDYADALKEEGIKEGRVEGAIEKLNLVLEKSYFISRTEVSIKQVPTLRIYIKDLIKQLERRDLK